jgi:hypothetical protein
MLALFRAGACFWFPSLAARGVAAFRVRPSVGFADQR